MKRYYVDLKPVFNQRYVFPYNDKLPSFLEENFKFGEVGKDGLIVFIDRNADKQDNAFCDGQTIDVPDVPCDRVAIAGTCGWGIYKEDFRLEFADGTVDYAMAKFYDQNWAAKPAIEASMDWDAAEYTDYNHILASYEKSDIEQHEPRYKECYIYYYITDIKTKGRRLRRIIFPDNMFMNIFAITLEAE